MQKKHVKNYHEVVIILRGLVQEGYLLAKIKPFYWSKHMETWRLSKLERPMLPRHHYGPNVLIDISKKVVEEAMRRIMIGF